MQIDDQTVDEAFSYHVPLKGEPERFEAIRSAAKSFAKTLLDYCPQSRERSVALTHLQEAVMMANASVVLNRPPAPGDG